jgi:hypothetical protein
VVLGAVGPQDVQAFPATPDAHQEPLADQQPAAVEHLHAPDRMAGIDEIASGLLPVRLPLLPLIGAEELLLLGRVGLPEEARGLVVTDTDAV